MLSPQVTITNSLLIEEFSLQASSLIFLFFPTNNDDNNKYKYLKFIIYLLFIT